MRIAFAALLCLCACGSVPYWYRSGAPLQECAPTVYVYLLERGYLGLTIRYADCAQSFVVRGPYQNCVASHEKRHREGWTHDDRPTYRIDCGDGTSEGAPYCSGVVRLGACFDRIR